MNESTNQNTIRHQSTEEATSSKAVDSTTQINTEQTLAQTATLAKETIIPLTQDIETMTSDIRLVVREAREQTRQARVANASLKIIAFGTTLLSLAILIGVVYLLKDILALVVVSFLIAYIISPIVDLTERRGINRTLVVIIITLLMLSGFAFLSTVMVSSITGQIWKFSEVLLTVELGHEDALDRREIPEALRQKFLEEGITLSQNTVIAVEEAGNNWKLTDTGDHRAYNIRKEENQLKVNNTLAYLVDLENLVDTATTALNLIPKPLRIPVLNYLEITEGVETSTGVAERNVVQTIDRDQVSALVGRLQDQILGFVIGQSQSIFNAIGTSAKGAFSVFTTGIIILFLTFFLLNSGRQMKKAFIQIVPNRFFEVALVLIQGLDRQLGDYLRSRLIQTIILSIIAAIGYWILGLRFAILIGIIAGLANLIPYIGPFIGAIPAIIVVFLDSRFGLGWSLLAVIVLTLMIQVIDNAIITPLIIGKSVELGPVTTIVVVLLGEQLLGLIGLLMAVPIAAMCKLIIEEVWTEFKGYSQSILVGH
jgi:predicted PurR-regulated permease PerM